MEADLEYEGFRIILTRANDGTMLVFIDTPEDTDQDEDGTPRCRVYINDDSEPVYENPALKLPRVESHS